MSLDRVYDKLNRIPEDLGRYYEYALSMNFRHVPQLLSLIQELNLNVTGEEGTSPRPLSGRKLDKLIDKVRSRFRDYADNEADVRLLLKISKLIDWSLEEHDLINMPNEVIADLKYKNVRFPKQKSDKGNEIYRLEGETSKDYFRFRGVCIPNLRQHPKTNSHSVNVNTAVTFYYKMLKDLSKKNVCFHADPECNHEDVYVWYNEASGGITFDDTIIDSLRKCYHKRFIAIPFAFKLRRWGDKTAHMNFILIDRKKNKIYAFEPHGNAQPEMTEAVYLHVVEALGINSEGLSFEMAQSCPMGLQARQEMTTEGPVEGGFCVAWSLLYTQLTVLNENHSNEEILAFLYSFTNEELNEYIRRYTGFIETTVADILLSYNRRPTKVEKQIAKLKAELAEMQRKHEEERQRERAEKAEREAEWERQWAKQLKSLDSESQPESESDSDEESFSLEKLKAEKEAEWEREDAQQQEENRKFMEELMKPRRR